MELNDSLSYKAQQDIELVEKALSGDQKAYAQLLGKYRDAIYYMLLKMVNNPIDAEDLTIEAFGKAFKNIKQYTPNFAFSTWLFKIASNNCIDHIRKQRGSTVSLDQTVDEGDSLSPSSLIQSDTPDPEASMINEQKIKMMRDVVAKLKPRYRSLIELRYFKEYSYEEIADQMELPIGTVKAQLFRARELLLNILKNTDAKTLIRMELLRKYFPDLSDTQLKQFELLSKSVSHWNEKINVISRKDISHLEERHFIHSLAIAKFISFKPGTKIIDVGTGGGFPGLPLAIMFPDCEFTLADSIAKKIRVVNELASNIQLMNVIAIQARAETISEKFDFVVSRAVAAFPKFYGWTKGMIKKESLNDLPNGILYLKGGDLSQELGGFGKRIIIKPVIEWFDEEWFDEKYIVYLKL